ncbi:MAG: FliH/SctL family protein [Agathobacter sp.]
MSNLLKQYFVVNKESERRIINADERYVNKRGPIQDSASSYQEETIPGSEEVLDEFLAGLAAEEIYEEPEASPEDLIAQARAEAEEIIATAQAEAIKYADNARLEAETLYEKSRQEGYNEGSAKLHSEVAEEKARMQEELIALKHQLKEEHEKKLETMESDIIDAVIMVFRHVFNIQFENKKQILLYLVHNTLMNVEVGKEFHIRVASANYKFIESHIGDIKEKIGNDIDIEIVNDMTLGPEDCIIETESGVFNCGIDMELTNLEKDIRSLCS